MAGVKATYRDKYGCFGTTALGELRYTAKGRAYRSLVLNRELTHPTRDFLAAQGWVSSGLKEIKKNLRSAAQIDFETLSELYLEDCEPRLGPEAYDRTNENLERFGLFPAADDPNRMDRRPAALISRSDIETYRDSLVSQGLSAAYITDGLLCTLKTLFRWAAALKPGKLAGLPLPSNPMIGLKAPVVVRRSTRKVDPLEVSRFLRWAWRRACSLSEGPAKRHAKSAVVLLLVLRDTGARPKELGAAEWSDWTLRTDGWGVIRLDIWKWKNGHKTGQERVIAVPPHCAKRIEAIRALEGRHPTRIFTHRRGRGKSDIGTALAGEPWVTLDPVKKRKGSTKALQQWFKRLREEGEKAGYKFSHGMRLYFNRSVYTTQARRKGVNDALLATSLGTSIEMMDRHYTDLDESDVLAVAKASAARYSPSVVKAPLASPPRSEMT